MPAYLNDGFTAPQVSGAYAGRLPGGALGSGGATTSGYREAQIFSGAEGEFIADLSIARAFLGGE